MANWYGASRTNYFRVKDPEAFKTEMERLGVNVWPHHKKPILFALGAGDADDGNWPRCDSDETDEDIGFIELVAQHLADKEVAVFVTAGAEKLHYVTGHAIAVNNTGKHVVVNIDSIYDMAKIAFGVSPTRAEY